MVLSHRFAYADILTIPTDPRIPGARKDSGAISEPSPSASLQAVREHYAVESRCPCRIDHDPHRAVAPQITSQIVGKLRIAGNLAAPYPSVELRSAG